MSEDSLDGDIETTKKKSKRERKQPASEYSSSKLSVKHLPDSCTNEMLASVFGDCPGVKLAFVVAENEQRCNGNGFVQFGSADECRAALAKMQGFKFMGRKLVLAYAKRRVRQKADLDSKPAPIVAEGPKQRSGRLIVRNMAFKTNEKDLRDAFEAFGALKDCVVVSKDGKPKGFGFVEFEDAKVAQRAVQAVNGKEIRGRVVAVDLCLPKNAYIQRKDEVEKDEDDEEEKKVEASDGEEEEEEGEKEANDEEEDDDDDDDMGLGGEQESEKEEDEEEGEKPAVDLEELRAKEAGRKVFVQNLPFEATRKDVIMAFKECGRIDTVVMVTDPATGRPRGTCFVVFAEAESANKCLEKTGREVHEDYRFRVAGRAVYAVAPLGAKEVKNISQKRKENKAEYVGFDKRNIALADVGRIDQDSPQWAQLSKNDKEKRQAAILKKKQKLKNPNFLVSPVRLSVRNLTKQVDESKLRHMFSSGKAGMLKQVVVLKDESGVSKGYGFVEFRKHEDALNALHRVNNNAQFFGAERRPIVEFAIDDARKVRLREAKTEKNRESQKKRNAEPEPEPEQVAAKYAAEAAEKKQRRKLTKHKKREMKERTLRRDEVKKAKQARRAKKREQREHNAADDDVEIMAKARSLKKNKKNE